MTDMLLEILPILLYITAVILIVALIILVIKLIKTMTVVNKVAEDAYEKMESLNKTFGLIDRVTDGLSKVSDTVIESLIKFASNLFKKKKTMKEEEDEEE